MFEDPTLPRRLEKKIARLIQKGRMIYGSDATVQNGRGVFAWGFMDKTNNKKIIAKYHAPLHGNADQTHSTRGELFGLLACLRHIYHLSQNYYMPKVREVMIYVYTDSASSISIAGKKLILSTKTSAQNDADIKAGVQHFFGMLKYFVKIKHVKAHQDRNEKFSKLSYASKLNVIMDKHADKALSTHTVVKYSAMIPHLPCQTVSFQTPYERITRNVITEVNRAKIGHEAEEYLKSRLKFNDDQMKNGLGKELGQVINDVPFYRKMHYSHILHKQWPTMKRNLAWKYSETDKCPLCSTCIEGRHRVFVCKDALAIAARDRLLINLRDSITKIHTDPFLVNHIFRIFRLHHSEAPVPQLPILSDDNSID